MFRESKAVISLGSAAFPKCREKSREKSENARKRVGKKDTTQTKLIKGRFKFESVDTRHKQIGLSLCGSSILLSLLS